MPADGPDRVRGWIEAVLKRARKRPQRLRARADVQQWLVGRQHRARPVMVMPGNIDEPKVLIVQSRSVKSSHLLAARAELCGREWLTNVL